jgi:DNA mismatch repair protein MutS2
MPFPLGADVVVTSLGKKRGTVVAEGRKGQYQVRVEGATMWCHQEDLAAPPKDGKPKRRRSQPDALVRKPASAERPPAARVDLHGLSVEEAIERVISEINRALQQGADRLEVVHGIGSGRIKRALHRQLSSISIVTAFALDGRNGGVTWVYF